MAKVKTSVKPQPSVAKKSHNQNLWIDKQLAGPVNYMSIEDLRLYDNNPRVYTPKQIEKIEVSLLEFGFLIPILIESDGLIIVGHARVMAAQKAGYTIIPVIAVDHLNADQIRAFRIMDNRLSEEGGWDYPALALEFNELLEIDIDLSLTGFDFPEIDLIIQDQLQSVGQTQEEEIPPPHLDKPPISRAGDKWRLGRHQIFCGDAREKSSYNRLMGSSKACLILTDPPYNERVRGHIRVSLNAGHGDFLMASGELSDKEFTDFLHRVFTNVITYSEDGSLHYIFMDWRHVHLLQSVCEQLYHEQVNLCIWIKPNGGMGSLYRSQHELVVVYKHGSGKHRNNIQLGKYGRNRTNVWSYAGANSFGPDRQESLDLHPTVKPVEMIADAILDASAPGDIVLDPFLGSGTLIIAAEKTGRSGRGMELDPRYLDVCIRRWQDYTGEPAIHAETGLTFSEMALFGRSGIKLLPPPSSSPSEGGALS